MWEAKQETWTETLNLIRETSYGVIGSEDGVEVEITVGLEENHQYGWFEIYDIKTQGEKWYAEGGLWFQGNKLTDYDGTFELLDPVKNKLKEWGKNLDDF